MLTAYYDLQFSPPTYDVVAALSLFEVERRAKCPDDPLHVVFVPGSNGGFRRDRFWPQSIPMRELMRDRVAVPMAKMMPTTSVEVLQYRPNKIAPNSIGFGQSLYGLAVHVKALAAGIRPLRAPLTPRRNPKLITITLRECEHWPQRNSNVNAWLSAAIAIRERGYDVVIVRDAAMADAGFGDFTIRPDVSRDLERRAQFYRSAICNLGVNNGPVWFAIALDAPVLMLKPTVEGVMHTCSAKYFQECGIEPGGQIPNSPDYQRIVWADDAADNIVQAFDAFMGSDALTKACA